MAKESADFTACGRPDRSEEGTAGIVPRSDMARGLWDFPCFVFDLDGTLADSMDMWAQIDFDFLTRRDLPHDSRYLGVMRLLRFKEAAEYTIRFFSLPDTVDEVCAEWLLIAAEAYAERIELKPAAREMLETAAKCGKKMLLCTANERALAAPFLRRHRIEDYFLDCLYAPEYEEGKSEPTIWRLCAEKAGVRPSDCLVFEDALEPLQAARGAGLATVALADPYNQHEREALIRAADFYFEDFTAVLNSGRHLP